LRNLIKADLCRILKTKMLYVGTVIAVAVLVFTILRSLTSAGRNATGYMSGLNSALDGFIFPVVIALPVFIAVFSHELTSKSMQCILGHGLTRGKLITSKLLEAAILLAGIFAIIMIAAIVLASPEYAISSRQMTNGIIAIWLRALRFFGYICFSAMIMFIANSTSLGIIVCVAFTLVLRIGFMALSRLGGIEVYDYTIDGLLDWAYKSIEAGGPGLQIIPVFLYILAAVAITVIFFNRKEFEF
jgi:ABC-type transport system involved in multi-copper enzyme maturation permease subunit